MLQLILSALLVYISTSIDYLFLLLIIFTQSHTRQQKHQIYLGQYIGTAILVIISLIAAYLLHFIPEDWMIGLLGLIPIFLGVRFAIKGEEEAEEEDIIAKLENDHSHQLFWTVALMTIASGGDNLGIYIPFFLSLSLNEIIIVIIIFILSTAILCYLSERLANVSFISETLEKYERIIIPIVFIGLGIYILIENQTFAFLFH